MTTVSEARGVPLQHRPPLVRQHINRHHDVVDYDRPVRSSQSRTR